MQQGRQDIAAVIAQLKNTEVDIAFSSLHSWGFQLFNAKKNKSARNYSKNDIAQMKYGVAYTKDAFNNLQNTPLTVIAGDMNNNPANQPEQFNFIESRGFEVLEPDVHTNINGFDSAYQQRKIDFIFVPKLPLKQGIYFAVSGFFTSKLRMTYTSAHVLDGFNFKKDSNCSDHKPVVTTLKIYHGSTLSRIYTISRK